MEVRFLQFGLGLLLLLAAQHAPAIAVPSPQCQMQCGDFDIPYPFGIGDNCSLPGFNITCEVQDGILKPILFNVEILNISLIDSTMRVLNAISTDCYNRSYNKMDYTTWSLNFNDTPYLLSDVHNKFTVIGCSTLAYIANGDGLGGYQSGCVSTCSSLSDLADGSCSGMGCCQTAIPKEMNYYDVTFDGNFNTSQIWNFSRCSYAALLEAEVFNFSTAYISTTEFNDTGTGRVPVVIDWAIRNSSTCEVAKRNEAGTYACLSSNSECVDSRNGPGYVCKCSTGYDGNPYLPGGCQGNSQMFTSVRAKISYISRPNERTLTSQMCILSYLWDLATFCRLRRM